MNSRGYYFLKGGPTNWGYIVVLIIITFMIAGGILGYAKYVFEEMTSLSRLPEIEIKEKIEDETADWKTYRNEEYGFEMKYPKDWHQSYDSLAWVSIVFCSPKYYNPQTGSCKEERQQNVTVTLGEIRLHIGKWKDGFPRHLGKTKEEIKSRVLNCYGDVETRIINNIKVTVCNYDKDVYKDDNRTSVIWEDPSGFYLYHLFGSSDQDPTIFYQMLSTFRFLE